jgi:hypothetical protein
MAATPRGTLPAPKPAELYKMAQMDSHIRILIGKDLDGCNAALSWGASKTVKAGVGG